MSDSQNGQAATATAATTITFEDVCQDWHDQFENLQTFNRLLTTDAKIAQTPKPVVWTLNKAKLYRYVPLPTVERRHRLPLCWLHGSSGPMGCLRCRKRRCSPTR